MEWGIFMTKEFRWSFIIVQTITSFGYMERSNSCTLVVTKGIVISHVSVGTAQYMEYKQAG